MEDTQKHGEFHVSGERSVARETKCIYIGKLMQTLGLNLSTKKVIRSCISNCQMKVGAPRGGSGRGFSHQLPLHFTGWEGVETKAHKVIYSKLYNIQMTSLAGTHMLALLNECEGGSQCFTLEL